MRQRPAPLTSPCPRFNPRPPLLAGDAMDALDRPHEITVSIRARHCWRAMPARGLVAQLRQLKVSIRARHCWRAMPSTYQPRVMLASFQSAPAIAGGRCTWAKSWRNFRTGFQSAPAIAGGRCPAPAPSRSAGPGFNPRPPLLAGDAAYPIQHPGAKMFQSAPAIAGGRCVASQIYGPA